MFQICILKKVSKKHRFVCKFVEKTYMCTVLFKQICIINFFFFYINTTHLSLETNTNSSSNTQVNNNKNRTIIIQKIHIQTLEEKMLVK